MTDRPILFSGPMVRAILDGRKTQTRRVLPKGGIYEDISSEAAEDFELRGWDVSRHGEAMCAAKVPVAVGARLWVREAWAPLDALTHADPGVQALADRGFYRADESTVEGEISRWRPSIHMPRWASRITLIVTEVRVQRLQEISDGDGYAEGIPRDYLESVHGPNGFRDLWDSINADRAPWESNPWIAAYTFRPILGNIDQIGDQA